MSYVAKTDKVRPVEEAPKKRTGIRILKDVPYEVLAAECRVCQLLKFNKGSCGGRRGQNICLAFKESPSAKLREKAFQ
ncbi:MAG: hypothetical protein K0S75_840 [Clostridia bacterium]|nr:hypothetical protein [Clostridia bacterium]